MSGTALQNTDVRLRLVTANGTIHLFYFNCVAPEIKLSKRVIRLSSFFHFIQLEFYITLLD